jgi:hypothetical protein
VSRILALFCLLLVASTTPYGLQLTAAAMQPAAATVDEPGPATGTRTMLIVAVDPVTGDRAQLECQAPSSAFGSDVVVVDAEYFSEIARVCTYRN